MMDHTFPDEVTLIARMRKFSGRTGPALIVLR
jgi:hypothetical protein